MKMRIGGVINIANRSYLLANSIGVKLKLDSDVSLFDETNLYSLPFKEEEDHIEGIDRLKPSGTAVLEIFQEFEDEIEVLFREEDIIIAKCGLHTAIFLTYPWNENWRDMQLRDRYIEASKLKSILARV